MYSRRNLIKSFFHAMQGIYCACRSERNMIIHLIIAAGVVASAFIFRLDKMEFIIVIFCIGLVLACETINTAFEYLVDLFHGPQLNPIVRILKDIASGAVLIASICSAIIGAWIFFPKLFH